METQKPLLKDEDGEEVDVYMYRLMIGSLMYLTSSRLDIMFAVCAYARYQVNPKVSHLYALKRIFSDKKQTVVQLPQKEAEYVAASSLLWTCDFGLELYLIMASRKHVRIKSFLMLFGITAALNDVNAAQSKLVLLCKVNAAEEVNAASEEVSTAELVSTAYSIRTKVGLIARVESSRDEVSLGDDASRQGRINAIDVDEDITLVNDQDDVDIFDVNTLTGDEVLAEPEVVVKDVNLTISEVTLAQALAALKSVKPNVKPNVVEEPSVPVSTASTKVSAATTTATATIPTPRKGIVITELGTSTTTTTISSQLEEPMKPLKKKVQIMLDEKATLKLQAKFDEEEILAREKYEANIALTKEWDDIQAKIEADHELAQRRTDLVEGSSKRAGIKLGQEVTKKQKMDDVQETIEVDDDQEAAKIKELMEIVPDEEEVAIDAIPLATKPPTIIDWKNHKEGKKNYY
ncbi:hypothetical protein Tco_0300822 [Tanacetum coccineum]